MNDPSDQASASAGSDSSPLRRIVEAAVPVIAVLVTVVLPVIYHDRLPDPMAIHWGAGGSPDGAGSRLADAVLMAGTTALLAGGPFLALRSAPRTMAQFLMGSAWAMSVFFAGLRWMTLEANAHASDWTQAAAMSWPHVGGVTAAGAVAAVLGYLVAGDRPERSMPRVAVSAAQLEPGEMVVWHGTLTTAAGQIGPVVVIIAAGILWPIVPRPELWIVMASLALTLLAASLLSKVSVTVGPSGLIVRLGYLGWPRATVAIDQVESVTVEEVVPLAYGGWGYRKVPGATAIVLRKGPGLRIERRGRSDLVVTIDDPEQAGSVLLAHREAAGDPRN